LADRPQGSANEPDDGEMLGIVEEEEHVLGRVLGFLASRSSQKSEKADYDQELISLRDQISEARMEDVPALIAQMERLQAVAARRADVSGGLVDVRSPYFGRIVLQEMDRKREVLIGRATYLDPETGLRIVDWRDAPVSRVYYCYDEGDDYDEVFGNRPVEGEVQLRRSLAIADGVLRRVGSPQGTFVRKRNGDWARIPDGSAELSGGQGTALRPEQHRGPAKLGVDIDGEGREDKHLQEIAALIDPRQFGIITQPESGLVVIQGGAGSGKTTVGLHRMAYLAYRQPGRFRADRMIVVTFNEALARYVSRVLPALGVPGVAVITFRRWAQKRRLAAVAGLPAACTEETPATVIRLKKHPAMLRVIDSFVAAREESFRNRLGKSLPSASDADTALRAWDSSSGDAFRQRLAALARWNAEKGPKVFSLAARHAIEREVGRERDQGLDVAGVWSELLTDREGLRSGFELHAPGDFTDIEIDEVFRWSVARCAAAVTDAEEKEERRARDAEQDPDLREREVGVDGRTERKRARLDWEDNALLLRIAQRVNGALQRGKEALQYAHVFVDEAQDLSPLELRVLLDTVRSGSVTLAGDVAQRILMDNGFTDWKAVLGHLGLADVQVEPLKLSYRSTFEIIQFANHVLGEKADYETGSATRHGVPVEVFRFVHSGEAVGFLAEALRALAHSEPLASIAVVSRYAEQANIYYQGLSNAEVPNLRRIADQDFPFKPGVDVTDVRQVKGLEFDYVVLVEVTPESYGEDEESRHLLHIAATRAAHQLWLLVTGAPSGLLPAEMRERGF
jgi:DNA helicase-2/ATP-dependent DNA helicase PcrA